LTTAVIGTCWWADVDNTHYTVDIQDRKILI
jgi:hypothetical protein